MITPSFTIDNSSINAVKAKVEFFNGSTLAETCTCSDKLLSFTVDRDENNNKFFGFGICQSIKIELADLERELNITKGEAVIASFGDGTNFVSPYPKFYVEEVERDEDTNALTITAYDALYKASATPFTITATSYTISSVVVQLSSLLGLSGNTYLCDTSAFLTSYPEGANFEGNENVRQVANAVAEATQTIYYISNDNKLVFRKLGYNSTNPVFTISKDKYFTLKTGANETITAICSATELGDNITAGTTIGATQYVRNNPFWDLREDRVTLVDNAVANIGGLSINQFVCESWEGNFLLEIGDKIGLEAEDGSTIITYVLNDTVVFDGTLSETTQWSFASNETETPSNPSSLGEMLNQTYARVDKANKQIELFVSEAEEKITTLEGENGELKGTTETHTTQIGALQINADSISASVSRVEENTQASLSGLNDSIESLSREVSLKMSAEDVSISIQSALDNGVDKVETETGFTFNEEGLTISKSDSEISTQITENGMTIKRSNENVLVANHEGVQAEDLHATTYFIIGNNSRIEDWGDRTACFWIGG